MRKSSNTKALNRKAFFNYELKDSVEAGIVLTGDEIKAVRIGKANLTGSHVRVINGEAFLLGSQIDVKTGDKGRTRKLLLHKEEITRLAGKYDEKGLALVPLKIYLKRGLAKVNISLGKGKKIHDKRAAIKQKDLDREESKRILQ
jgi:SsrA-binding protein